MRGQALAVFTLALTTVLMAAALAFDAGAMILERRDQQNAADAAAIAGARYMPTSTTNARDAALDVATANGFTDGVNSASVDVNIPPLTGPNAGRSGFIEVQIGSTRPSIFAGVMGIADWQVAARAVAVNGVGGGGTFAILSLEPTECDAFFVSGNGSVVTYGDIQVNSTCSRGALRRQGNGDITVDVDGGACNVVGDIEDGGGQGDLVCVPNEGAPSLPDPLAGLSSPPMPALPQPPDRISGTRGIPSGCPGGSNAATATSPRVCQFQSSYSGTTWRLYPGLYPGGIHLQAGTFYLEPGIYWIGGGGLQMNGNGTDVWSVRTGGTNSCWSGTPDPGDCGGVLFYNTQLPGSAAGPIHLNGAQADIHLHPYQESPYGGLVIFQDQTIDVNGDDITLNGSSSGMVIRGTMYSALGQVKVNGSGGSLTLDQVIADMFQVNGAPGSQITALKDDDFIYGIDGAGLVE